MIIQFETKFICTEVTKLIWSKYTKSLLQRTDLFYSWGSQYVADSYLLLTPMQVYVTFYSHV